MKSVSQFFALLLLVNLGACATTQSTSDITDSSHAVNCPEQRPVICTRDYRPVCATLNDSTKNTYANGCEACADHNVQSHIPGECQ
jgi:hypothetical protein